jgi:hypothetical protein
MERQVRERGERGKTAWRGGRDVDGDKITAVAVVAAASNATINRR